MTMHPDGQREGSFCAEATTDAENQRQQPMLKSLTPIKRGGAMLAISLLAATLSLGAPGQARPAAADGLSYTMLFVEWAPDAFPPSGLPPHTGLFWAWTRSSLANPAPGIAFVFDWGDGTTTRYPATGYRYPYKPGAFVMTEPILHTFPGPGTYTVRLTAMDELGHTQTDIPAVLTVPTG
jgi:hypothetical protein